MRAHSRLSGTAWLTNPGCLTHDDRAVRDDNAFMRFSFARHAFLVIALAALPALAVAQTEFPSRPVKIVVPVAPGGAPDVVARLLADRLSALWAQPVVVENRSGAGERIGADAVAKAAPDGY